MRADKAEAQVEEAKAAVPSWCDGPGLVGAVLHMAARVAELEAESIRRYQLATLDRAEADWRLKRAEKAEAKVAELETLWRENGPSLPGLVDAATEATQRAEKAEAEVERLTLELQIAQGQLRAVRGAIEDVVGEGSDG